LTVQFDDRQVSLVDRPAPASLIRHSDRGVQYCARAYVELLQSYGIRISKQKLQGVAGAS
jgi:transposase InsO family protein